jgi:hypothetical protein
MMMTPYQSEELENIRRQASKGKRLAEDHIKLDDEDGNYRLVMLDKKAIGRIVDVYVNILDQVERIKNENKAKDSPTGH